MNNITIHHVETLHIGESRARCPRPRRRALRAGLASARPLAIQPTCQGMQLSWPRGNEESAPPPMSMLRAAIAKPCQDCAGTGRITYNPSDEVGHFETRKCSSCSPQAQGKE